MHLRKNNYGGGRGCGQIIVLPKWKTLVVQIKKTAVVLNKIKYPEQLAYQCWNYSICVSHWFTLLIYSWISIARTPLAQTTAYVEVKWWSLLNTAQLFCKQLSSTSDAELLGVWSGTQLFTNGTIHDALKSTKQGVWIKQTTFYQVW